MTTSALLAARARLCFDHAPAWDGHKEIDRSHGSDTCLGCITLREDAVDRLCSQCYQQPRLYGESRCADCQTNPAPIAIHSARFILAGL